MHRRSARCRHRTVRGSARRDPRNRFLRCDRLPSRPAPTGGRPHRTSAPSRAPSTPHSSSEAATTCSPAADFATTLGSRCSSLELPAPNRSPSHPRRAPSQRARMPMGCSACADGRPHLTAPAAPARDRASAEAGALDLAGRIRRGFAHYPDPSPRRAGARSATYDSDGWRFSALQCARPSSTVAPSIADLRPRRHRPAPRRDQGRHAGGPRHQPRLGRPAGPAALGEAGVLKTGARPLPDPNCSAAAGGNSPPLSASASGRSPGAADPPPGLNAGAYPLHKPRNCLRTIRHGCRLRRRGCGWRGGRGRSGRG